jgi:4'-phosphopantetheinyl transferase
MVRKVNAVLAIDVWHEVVMTDYDQHLQYWRVLDNAEKTRAEKFKSVQLQQRYVTAHGCLRNILAHHLNVSPETIRIEKTVQGKPYLVDYPELAFNLSHTGDHLLVAVAENCQLGVDIEQCKYRPILADLVHRCFGTEEITYWQQLPEAEQLGAFYQFWTRKEAFVKATGFGIALGLRECVLNPEYPHTFLAVPASCGLASDWHSRDIAVGEGMCAALVADKAIATMTLKSYSI